MFFGNDFWVASGYPVVIESDYTNERNNMQSARAYLFAKGLTKAPTGKGRFSREGHEALAAARASGVTFTDDLPVDKPVKAPKVSVATAPKSIALPGAKSVDPKAVRKWAGDNGLHVGERGRIHVDVINAYLESKGEAGEDVEKRENEFNVYADLRRETYPRDAIFTGTYEFGGKTHTMKANSKAACCNCKTSLVICQCGNPTVVSAHGSGPVSVKMIGR